MRKTRRVRRIGGKNLTKGQFGGKKLGEGTRGSVYSPPLKCQEGDDDTWATTKYASKTMLDDHLETEYRNSFLVKELDPKNKWSLTALHACTIRNSQPNTNYKPGLQTRQLIFKNGGKSLADMLVKTGVQHHWSSCINDPAKFKHLEPKALPIVIKQIKKILPGLEQLNAKYVHKDLHLGNIVTDGKTPRIIDFSSMQPLDERIAEEQKLMSKCITVKKDDDACSFLPERLQILVADEAKSRDIQTLWSELHELLSSPWANATFPDKYTAWTTKYNDLSRFVNLCPEYIISIMNVPA